MTAQTIDDEASLRTLLGGDPSPLVQAKCADHLTPETRKFVERAPFVCIATSDAGGNCDVSPRGDPPGFVRILDDRTVLIPDRPGNKLADTLTNILRNPHVGLLFVIPGATDTFRINGRATIISDPALLAPSTVEGKAPKLGILVDIDVCFTQCSKALLRSQLWDPTRFVAPGELPTGGCVLKSILGEEFDSTEYDMARAGRYARREGFY